MSWIVRMGPVSSPGSFHITEGGRKLKSGAERLENGELLALVEVSKEKQTLGERPASVSSLPAL